jgi:hypothetical protein
LGGGIMPTYKILVRFDAEDWDDAVSVVENMYIKDWISEMEEEKWIKKN